MFAITRRHRPAAGFTLPEVLVATFIAFYVIAAAWAVYMMTSAWWKEINPEVEAARVARSAVSSIIYGSVDATAGADTIGMNTHYRRNGIAWARFDAGHTPPDTPVISTDKNTIDFRLEADSSNARQFRIAADPATGLKAVYYQSQMIRPTLGLTGLQFSYYTSGGTTTYNVIKVVATVEKDILGTRNTPKHIKVEYAGYAYLKNSL